MKPEEKEKVEKGREKSKEQEKKPYSTPKLTSFGDTEELTGAITADIES
jgi:hypothetical protein